MKWTTVTAGVVIVTAVALLAPHTALAAPPCPAEQQCRTTSYGSGQGGQMSFTPTTPYAGYPANTRFVMKYDSQNRVTSTDIFVPGKPQATITGAPNPNATSPATQSPPANSGAQPTQSQGSGGVFRFSDVFGLAGGVIEDGYEAVSNGLSALNPFSWFTLDTLWWILSGFAYMFFYVAQFLMWLGTTIFDNALYLLVTNMGTFIQHKEAQGIRDAWEAIRDLMNIAIIGGFIAVGFSTILQVQQYNASRFLARLIIAALLVNFSYFFAGAVIDASNYIAIEAQRSQLMPEECIELDASQHIGWLTTQVSSGTLYLVGTDGICSISATFTHILKLSEWDNMRTLLENSAEGTENVDRSMFLIGMLGGFMFIIVGFIFFSAAVLIIARFVALILLLIASPVGVAGSNIPFIDGFAKKWWSALFSQAFFAPIFIILVAIGLKILFGVNKILETSIKDSNGNYVKIVSGRFDDAIQVVPLLISFGVGIGFMYAALQVARSMSENGKEFVGGIYEGVQKRIGGFYGNAYQATAGRMLQLPSAVYDATIGQVARIPVIGGIVGGLTNPIGRALRQDPGAKPFGADLSNADAAKAAQEYVKSLENFSAPMKMVRHPIESFNKLTQALGTPVDNLIQKLFGIGSIADLLKKDPSTLEAPQRRLLERYVQSMKDEDIDKMSKEDLDKLVPFMSVKQYKRVMERSDFNEKQRRELQDKRWAPLEKARKDGNSAEVARLLKNMDKNERKLLLIERDEYRNDKQILSALDAKTYDDVINDSDIYSEKSDYHLKDASGNTVLDEKGEPVDIRDERARAVANDPGNISETDAKRIKNDDVKNETIGRMTPAQARRVYKNTKDEALRARLAARFKDLEGPGPAQNDEDEDADKKKKEEDKKKEEEDKK